MNEKLTFNLISALFILEKDGKYGPWGPLFYTRLKVV